MRLSRLLAALSLGLRFLSLGRYDFSANAPYLDLNVVLGLSRNGQFLGLVLVHSYPGVRTRELTREQLACVQCPTCGVPAGKRCERYSGALRKEPHVDRKLAAVEAIERKRVARRA